MTDPPRPAVEPLVPGQPLASEPVPTEPSPPEVAAVAVTMPPVESTRRLLGASFELLTRTSDEMRRASFYIGLVVLVTVVPAALASWALEVGYIHHTQAEFDAIARRLSGADIWLGLVAVIGIVVAAVESRALAAAILGSHLIGRPITVRQAVARSRSVFWLVVVGSIIVGIPVTIAQGLLNRAAEIVLGPQTDVSVVTTAIIAALVGAPLAYVLSGIVLGDVGPAEATRRSFRVFRARKVAAVLVAVFETLAVVLVILGVSAGLDVALRVFDALGVGADSGPAGLALLTIGIVAGVFALGTLIYTALALSVAPQVVMFVGLTHATFGLDHVRPGGDHDPALSRAGRPRFRWLPRTMWAAAVFGVIALFSILATLQG